MWIVKRPTYEEALAKKIEQDKKKRDKALNAPKLARKKPLRKKSKSTSAKAKERIQAKIRLLVIRRDGGCILRHYSEAGQCGGYNKDGELILQGEHLNGRANSVSYGEPENIVCLCQYHHIFFKKQQNALYWVLVRNHVGEKRWKKVQAWIMDRSSHRMFSFFMLRTVQQRMLPSRTSFVVAGSSVHHIFWKTDNFRMEQFATTQRILLPSAFASQSAKKSFLQSCLWIWNFSKVKIRSVRVTVPVV